MWQITRLSTWTSAGGQALADCGPCAIGESSIRLELGGRGEARLSLVATIAESLVRDRAVIRVDIEDGSWHEFRVTNFARPRKGAAARRCSIVAKPRIYDLADSDLVREVVGGRTLYTFDVALSIRDQWARFIAPRLLSDRLSGLALGTVATDAPVPLRWERWTYGQLVQGWLDATQLELQWRRSIDGLTEYLDFLEQVGREAPTLPLVLGGLLRDHQEQEDYEQLFTVARIAGERATPDSEAATIAENVWRVASTRTISAGRYGVALREHFGSRSPVVADGQFAAHPDIGLPARFLQFADGTSRTEILDAIASTGEVVVAQLPPASDGHVAIVADAAGSPLETVELPDAVRAYGYVVGDVPIAGGRGERQYLANGGHEDGLQRWAPVNSGAGVEIRRQELGITVTCEADGARGAAVGTGTPFTIRGLTPNVGRVLRGDELRVGGAVLPITVDAIPNAAGGLTLAVGAPGLPGNFADGSPFTLLRKEQRTLTLDGVQSPLAPRLRFTDSNTDGLWNGSRGALGNGTYASLAGANVGFSAYVNGLAGAAWVNATSDSDRAALNWGTYGADVYVLAGAVLSFTVGESTGTVTWSSAPTAPIVGTRLRYFGSNGLFQILRVTAISGSDLLVTTEYGGPIVIRGPGEMEACNVLLAGGTTWTFTIERETRILLADGPQTAGALSVTCKPQANIATRNWLATDTITLTRAVTPSVVVTAHSAADEYVPLTDENGDPVLDEEGDPILIFTGTTHTITIDSAASTLDEVFAAGDLPAGGVVVQFGAVTVRMQAGGLTGSTLAAFTAGASVPSGAIAAGTYSFEWILTETYPLTGTASWGTNGRVTLTLASAIPAGRSYPRGLPVSANWIGSGSMRLHAAVSGGAATVEVFGHDAFASPTSNPTAALRGALYRVYASASTLPVAGNTLYAQTTATADALGKVSVTLAAANPNAIADGAPITITRPQLVASTEPQTGSVLRLFCGVGGTTGEPSSSSAGWGHELARFTVPTDSTRQITALSVFGLSVADWMAPLGPVVAIVDASGAILGWSALGEDGALIEVAPGVVALQTRAIVSASGLYTVRVYGGSPTNYTLWCAHVRTLLFLGEASDVPYTRESFASLLQLVGTRTLVDGARPRITDTITVTELLAAHARALNVSATLLPRLTLGGLVHLEDRDRLVRVVAITRRPQATDTAVELGTVAPDGGRLLGATALAAGARRTR